MANSTLTQDRHFTPKYVDLARNLVNHIAKEGLTVGDRLGTEQEFVEEYGLSRVTVRQALELLESDGYIARKRARGTFVAREVESKDRFVVSHGRVLLLCSAEQKSNCDEDSAFLATLRAIEQSLSQSELMVQIMSIGLSPRDDRVRLSNALSQEGLHGVLTIGSCAGPYTDLLADTPVVTTCSFYPTHFPWVGGDVSTATHVSVGHLLEQGHNRVAMLCGSWIDGRAFADFAKGMKAAMDDHGLKADRLLMVHNYPGESLEDLAVSVLELESAPTAVFCENWRVCGAVIKACTRLGLSIPDDLSVVGYGLNVSQMNEPVRFTAYVPDTTRIGELAAQIMADLLNGKAPPAEPVVVEGNLISGESVRKFK